MQTVAYFDARCPTGNMEPKWIWLTREGADDLMAQLKKLEWPADAEAEPGEGKEAKKKAKA